MAVEKRRSIYSDLRGPIGPLVCTSWKGIPVVKTRPQVKNVAKKSKEQIRQRGKFSAVQQFLKMAAQAIRCGYQLRKNEKMSALNAATSYHISNALIISDNEIKIDLSKVKFSRPLISTEEVYNAQVICREDGIVEFKWELNAFPSKSTQLDDKAWFVVYNATRRIYLIENGVLRNELGAILTQTQFHKGHEVFCYMFFVSADSKRVSETTYLGMVIP